MPKDICSVRINRLNTLLRRLLISSSLSAEELMDAAEITSRRMLQRDICYLKEFYGAEIEYDRRKMRYSCKSPGTFFLQLRLTEDEITALSAGLEMVRHFLPHLGGACADIWRKFEGVLPSDSVSHGKELGDNVKVSLPVARMDSGLFRTLLEAARAKQAVSLLYCSPYSGKGENWNAISPWKFYFQEHAWYMLAWNHAHKQEGVWRLSRVKGVRLLRESYVPCPDGFDFENITASAWFGWSKDLKYDVELKIKPPLASSVAEIIWHPTQTIEEQPDGSVVLRARVSDIEPVKWWVKKYDNVIDVIKL